MEKKKLKLNDLKVQSFVTEFDKDKGQTLDVQGGIDVWTFNDSNCPSWAGGACNTRNTFQCRECSYPGFC